jgi:hypothetical protein
VIARLQAAGLNATSMQNPLTTLPEAVASAQRVLDRFICRRNLLGSRNQLFGMNKEQTGESEK